MFFLQFRVTLLWWCSDHFQNSSCSQCMYSGFIPHKWPLGWCSLTIVCPLAMCSWICTPNTISWIFESDVLLTYLHHYDFFCVFLPHSLTLQDTWGSYIIFIVSLLKAALPFRRTGSFNQRMVAFHKFWMRCVLNSTFHLAQQEDRTSF